MMKIVVLDGYTANPGDIDWSPWHALGEVQIYDRTAPGEVLTYITPHIAWATLAARRRLLQVALDNLRAFIAGHPCNVVNP